MLTQIDANAIHPRATFGRLESKDDVVFPVYVPHIATTVLKSVQARSWLYTIDYKAPPCMCDLVVSTNCLRLRSVPGRTLKPLN
jgi:hypothetical protein